MQATRVYSYLEQQTQVIEPTGRETRKRAIVADDDQGQKHIRPDYPEILIDEELEFESPELSRKKERSEEEPDFNMRTKKRGRALLHATQNHSGLSLQLTKEAGETISDDEFAHLIGEWPACSSLTVSKGNFLTDAAIIRTIYGNNQLHTLNLVDCPKIDGWVLHTVANLTKLSVVKCDNVDNESVITAVSKCSKLRELHLDWSNQLDDSTLRAIGRHCPELREFSVSEAPQYTLNGLRALLRGCDRLKVLELWNCRQVNDAWIAAIIESPCQLKKLDIKFCKDISQHAINRLFEHFGPKFTLVC